MPNQYHPLPGEYVATGVIGIFIYAAIVYYSVQSVRLGIKSQSTRRFFFLVIVMALFEIPRFSAMAIEADYISTGAYCFHIMAGTFFFIAFSIVCRQWSGLLQLGSYFRAVYGRHGLILANIVFAIVDLLAVIDCAMSEDLSSYFNSAAFVVITFIEGVRNCVYSVFLAYYGVKLVRRFWHFSRIERQAAVHKNIFSYIEFWTTSAGTENAVFTKVVLRMTSVLVLSSVCFIMRVCMLIAKMAAVHSSDPITTPSFALFGFLWFCCSDFIPRSLPALAFIFLMRTKRPPAKEIKNSTSHKAGGHDEFQFVQLADDESFYNLSDMERSNSMSTTTEVILNADQFAPNNKRSLTPGDTYANAVQSKKNALKMHTLHRLEANASSHSLLPGQASHPSGQGQSQNSSHAYDAEQDEEDGEDDDFYSLDDDEWNGEPSIIDKFFSAITFSATHKATEPSRSQSSGSRTHTSDRQSLNAKEPSHDTSDIRL